MSAAAASQSQWKVWDSLYETDLKRNFELQDQSARILEKVREFLAFFPVPADIEQADINRLFVTSKYLQLHGTLLKKTNPAEALNAFRQSLDIKVFLYAHLGESKEVIGWGDTTVDVVKMKEMLKRSDQAVLAMAHQVYETDYKQNCNTVDQQPRILAAIKGLHKSLCSVADFSIAQEEQRGQRAVVLGKCLHLAAAIYHRQADHRNSVIWAQKACVWKRALCEKIRQGGARDIFGTSFTPDSSSDMLLRSENLLLEMQVLPPLSQERALDCARLTVEALLKEEKFKADTGGLKQALAQVKNPLVREVNTCRMHEWIVAFVNDDDQLFVDLMQVCAKFYGKGSGRYARLLAGVFQKGGEILALRTTAKALYQGSQKGGPFGSLGSAFSEVMKVLTPDAMAETMEALSAAAELAQAPATAPRAGGSAAGSASTPFAEAAQGLEGLFRAATTENAEKDCSIM